jgi:hypothetical protein
MAKDLYHPAVRAALDKDGWTITQDPYKIERSQLKSYEVDLGAEKFFAAERGSEKIAVEIKSFLGSSRTYDFHSAFGQYLIYRFFMKDKESDRKLFLAVQDVVFTEFFKDPDIELICTHFEVNILVFDIDNKTITTWITR